jgi:sugar lactone lactonase YvrE
MCVDAAGNLYFGDGNSRIRKVTAQGVIATAVAASELAVASLAVDDGGNLLLADSNRIRRIAPDGAIQTLAGGASGFSGDGGPAAAARLSGPRAIALDASGNLHIADTMNGRIRRIDASGTISTIAGR